MSNWVQLIIVSIIIVASIFGLIRLLSRGKPKDKGCADCPLKDKCTSCDK